MAERLRVRVMHAPFIVRNISLTVRASFGVAESRGRSPMIVLREAERALACAKEAGRDRVRCFEPEHSAGRGAAFFADKRTDDLPAASLNGRLRTFPRPTREDS
jgi:predicted signal transduction protein with EAL and GGDEF domain